jgi:hypothetical protein
MNEMMLKLRIWARAETTLLRINARRTGNRFTALAIALGFGVLAAGMINIGLFELLAESYGRAKGAFYLAGANALLAALVVFVAQRAKPGLEEEMVNEIREMALAELQEDADEIKDEFDRIAMHVKQIEDAVTALRGIGSGGTFGSLGPVVDLAVHALKTRHGGK